MGRSAEQYLLFGREASPTAEPVAGHPGKQPESTSASRRPRHLWLCVYLHHLPIEVLPGSEHRSRAVLTEHKRQARVLLCNAAASQLGIHPGLPANAALALVPDLELVLREIQLERETLQRLANWAIRFTPVISIDANNALLLDIGASLKLFGGLEALRESVIDGLAAHGHQVQSACAPTALASLWLARAGVDTVVHHCAELPARLASLPVNCLGWTEKPRRLLDEMGVRTLGECLRLPRDGLARRIGPERLRELDQGLGRQPEARALYASPGRFDEILELPIETADGELLLESLRLLLDRLKHFLVRHQGGVQVLWVRLHHDCEPPTLLRIGLLRTASDTAYLGELARIQFTDVRFPAPVVAISLQADLVIEPAQKLPDLLGGTSDTDEGVAGLLERLQVRLGIRAVHGLRVVAEHRPEFAWQAIYESGDAPAASASGYAQVNRPLWMLEVPMQLDTLDGRPVFQDVLSVESGPERIETGWWDGGDIRRDYYIARNPQGLRLWVFRDLRKSSWHLHGIFG